ncbi:MAG: DDE-type integrase/transposase/recombinase [Candidatus Edwardsbacteria bacterium]
MPQNKPYSQKVLKRYHILTLTANFKLTLKESVQQIGLSYRQIKRLFRRFINSGRKIESLLSKKVAWNKLDKSSRQKIIELHHQYPDFNNCHLADLFTEETGKKISHNTVRNIFIEQNLYQPRFKKHRPRKRFEMQSFGQLIQLDTSEHQWIPTVEKELPLIVAIDDFSRDPLIAFIFEHDTTWNNMKVVRLLIERYGLPEAIYTDNDSIFKYIRSDDPLHVKYHKDQEDVTTQFERALEEIGITLIRHKPFQPQAKGKLERFFRFLQDRFVNELKRYKLPKETHLAIKFANKVLFKYLHWWRNNHVHSITKCKPIDRHVPSVFEPLPKDINLDDIFCYKWERTVKNDNTFQFGNKTYQLTQFINKRSRPYGRITLHVLPGKWIRVFYDNKFVQQFPYRKDI